jgi:glycosyltransferase involved in cell wall biosynthesis
VLFRSRSGVPAVVTAHSTNAFKWFHAGMRLLAVSAAVRQALIDSGLPGERVAVTYNGMPDPGEPVPRDVVTFGSGRPLRLALVGRLEPVKGLDIALDALGLLRRDRGGNLPLHLTVVGPHETDWARQMRQKVQELDLGAVVTFLGHRQDVLALLAQTDLALAPSRREALSLALVEAAAVGCPALASRVGGIPEVVADGESGRLLPSEDARALADALAQVLADPACLPRWSAAARRRYRERFTVEAMCSCVVAQYRAAQAEKGGR